MDMVWQWFVENWGYIRLALVVLAGLASVIFVRFKGNVKEFALYVWAAVIELSEGGLEAVTQETVFAVADPLYDLLIETRVGPFLKLFMTRERLRQASWDLWQSFVGTLTGDSDDEVWAAYFYGMSRAGAKLNTSRVSGKHLFDR